MYRWMFRMMLQQAILFAGSHYWKHSAETHASLAAMLWWGLMTSSSVLFRITWKFKKFVFFAWLLNSGRITLFHRNQEFAIILTVSNGQKSHQFPKKIFQSMSDIFFLHNRNVWYTLKVSVNENMLKSSSLSHRLRWPLVSVDNRLLLLLQHHAKAVHLLFDLLSRVPEQEVKGVLKKK